MDKRGMGFWFIALVLMMCSIPAPAQSEWISFNGAKSREKPELKLDVSNSEQLVLDFSLPGMTVSEIIKTGASYQNIHIQDRGTLSEVGAPQLPAIGHYIAIPSGALARVEIIDSVSRLLTGYTIYPAQEPMPEVYGALPQKFKKDNAIYSRDSFYPSSIVTLDGPAVIRGLRVSILRISPVQYNPVQHSLRVYSKLKGKIIFQDGKEAYIEKRLRSPAFDNLFKALVLNPIKEPKIDGAGENNAFLLTITHPDFIEAAGRLTQWKREKGINSEIRTTLQTGTSASQIRAYIQHDYDGYADRRYAQTSEDLAIFLSDVNYLGQYQVDRIYYTYPYVNPRYWSKDYFGGGPAGDAGDPIHDYLRKNIFPFFSWDGDSADIISCINQGRFLLTHRDHGARSGWSDPYFTSGHVNSLANGNRLPVVWSINCQTGWFDNETDNIGSTSYTEVNFTEAWERNPNGGAIGVIGATRVSYSGFNDRLCWGWVDAI